MMPSPFECPTTPTALSPTKFTLGQSAPGLSAKSDLNVSSSADNMDENMAIDPTDQLHRLKLSEPVPDSRTKDEIIETLQAEVNVLKAEVKSLSGEVKDLKHLNQRSTQARQALEEKHSKKMGAMNKRWGKAQRVETQLAKLHKLIGDTLELETVERKDVEAMSGVSSSLEGEKPVRRVKSSAAGPIQPHEIVAALPLSGGILAAVLMDKFMKRVGEEPNQTTKKDFIQMVKENSKYGPDKLLRRKDSKRAAEVEEDAEMDGMGPAKRAKLTDA